MSTDPDQLEAQANAVYERVRAPLRDLLHEAARALAPFPPFPGALFTLGIEIDGVPGGDERGCVILGEDGELYELQLGLDADGLAAGANEPVLSREEQRVGLDDLAAAEYVAYAQRALQLVIAELRRRAE